MEKVPAVLVIYRGSLKYIYRLRILKHVSHDKSYKINRKSESQKSNKSRVIFKCNGLQFHLFLNELNCCPAFRLRAIDVLKNLYHVEIFLDPSEGREFLDYKWGSIINYLVWQTLELEYLMSWLSTLGGAFSSLGDYKVECAEIAAKISNHQLKLALDLGNPSMVARCNLFMSISLIQRQKFKIAKRIIRNEYEYAKQADDKLVRKMCLGIWSKLQYSHQISRTKKTK